MSAVYLVNPDTHVVWPIESKVPSVEMLAASLHANPFERLECVRLKTLQPMPAGLELVLVRRTSAAASLNEATAYTVAGERALGRSFLCARPSDAGEIQHYQLRSDPQVKPAAISHEQACALVDWRGQVAAEEAERIVDVEGLDSFFKWFAHKAGSVTPYAVVRLHGVDQAGRIACSWNVRASDWRLLRRAALDLFDRRWSVVTDLLLRDAPDVPGGNEETAPFAELVEIRAKPGGHSFECYGADGKKVYGVVHQEEISGAKLAKRSQRAIGVPGLPLRVGEDSILADFRLVS